MKIIIGIFLVFQSFFVFGQKKFEIAPKFDVGFHGEGIYTSANIVFYYEGNYIQRTKDDLPLFPSSGFGVSAGIDNNYFFKKDFRLSPKITLEYFTDILVLPVVFRVQNRLYPAKNLDYTQASYQICPEFGFCFYNMVSLTYGYNYALTNEKIIPNLAHQINISINFLSLLSL